MQYTNLGRSGLRISRLCLGCMSFGSPGWLDWNWILDENDAAPFFRCAVEAGINFFDTADSYSWGRSEEITGRWLKEYAVRDEIVIATKVFFGKDNRPNGQGLSRKHIEQACEASLKRLGVETIDLYQLHRLDTQTPIEETLSALDRLAFQGKIRYIGACSMYAWEFMRALGIADRQGWQRFIAMQNQYSLLYREEEREMEPLCQSEGVGMIPWSPLARGLLARPPENDRNVVTERSQTDGLQEWFQTPEDRTIAAINADIAAQRGIAPAQVALAWLLSRPAVAAPIIGVSKLQHLKDAVASLDVKLTMDETEALESPYRPKPSLLITPPFRQPRPGSVHDRE